MTQTIYIADIRRFIHFEKRLLPLLEPNRLKKMNSYRNSDDRLRCLVGGLLMDYIAHGQEIMFTKYDKPFLSAGPYFNLSHSGDYVCLVVSKSSPVGIDIERQRKEDFVALGMSAFHPDELTFFLQDPGMNLFFDIWTKKESYIKMIGTGFSLDSSNFCILPERMFLPFDQIPFLRNFNFINGYSLALCALDPIQASINSVSEANFLKLI
jgi:4'-phosphopantetheinyl transferase